MKKNIFSNLDTKILVKLNVGALIVTFFCEAFIVFTFITKGQQNGLEQWKYYTIIGALVLVSLLFLASLVSFVFFVRLQRRNRLKK
jgi:uncharacterized membrane protein